MSMNGSGVAVINSAGQPVVASTLITSTAFNALTADLATMISTAVMKDGQSTITADIPFSSNKITGLADGSSLQDAATIKNVINSTGVYVATVGGTADVITLSPSPSITAYVAGQTFKFIASGANTTNVTVAVSGLAAKAITKNGTSALVAGDIPSAMMVTATYDGTRFILASSNNLVNPVFSGTATGSLTGLALTTAVLTTSTVAADPSAALGVASKQYVDVLTNLVSHTSNATIAQSTHTALLSGASFTLTLNTAVGHTGQEIILVHNGTSLTQVYTIDGAGSETVDGTTTYILYTAGERLRIVSDGANWVVTDHQAETAWIDAGAMTILGSSSNPTKPATPDFDKVLWKRQGKEVFVRWVLQISSSAGATDGTGAYLFETPTGIAIDSTITPVATASATATMSEGIRSSLFGNAKLVIDSSAIDQGLPLAYDTTHVQWVRDGTSTPVGSASFNLTTSEMGYYMEARFPAANWRL